jgi:AcrR family transcriptional regulator
MTPVPFRDAATLYTYRARHAPASAWDAPRDCRARTAGLLLTRLPAARSMRTPHCLGRARRRQRAWLAACALALLALVASWDSGVTPAPGAPPRRRARGPAALSRARRQALVQIAYRHIAAHGFEGLRVRAVADEAGINHATLLHYFPTKEALIQAVVEYLQHEFQVSRMPRPSSPTPLDEVRLEFEDVRRRLQENPELMVVLTELRVRSRRDPAVAAALRWLDDTWHGYLVDMLRRGMAAGAFRADLDPAAAATALMAQIKGLGTHALDHSDPAELDVLTRVLVAQVAYWLTGGATP